MGLGVTGGEGDGGGGGDLTVLLHDFEKGLFDFAAATAAGVGEAHISH